jgi:hypothetical protein
MPKPSLPIHITVTDTEPSEKTSHPILRPLSIMPCQSVTSGSADTSRGGKAVVAAIGLVLKPEGLWILKQMPCDRAEKSVVGKASALKKETAAW